MDQNTEPTVTITTITTAIGGIITAVALTWPAVDDYRATILALVAVVYPIVTALWIRSKVVPTATAVPKATAQAAVNAAYVAVPGVDAKPIVK